MARLISDLNAFWDNALTGVAGNSAVVEVGRSVSNLGIWVTSSGITTIKIQVAQAGDLVNGVESDAAPITWHDLHYLGDPQTITFAGAGSLMTIIPDIALKFVRLQSSADMTVTAGYTGIQD